MPRSFFVLVVCACVGCDFVNNGSNLPLGEQVPAAGTDGGLGSEGGECPAIDDGGGAATLTGAISFPVVAAEEADFDHVNQNGEVVGSPYVQLFLLGQGAHCAGGLGICDGPAISIELQPLPGSPTDAGWNGTYAITPDNTGTPASLNWFPADAGLAFVQALSGQIQVTSTTACSLGGTFSGVMDIDGGSDGGALLSGTFQAVYAP